MPRLKYDEAEIIAKLSALPRRSRVLFAALCAMRLLPAYRRFHLKTGRGSAAAVESHVARLWADLTGAAMSHAEAQAALDAITQLIPAEADGWDGETQPYAEDAAAAVAYAFRAWLCGEPQEAAWAGRRVYEALDHFLVARQPGSSITPAIEEAILSSPQVQAELHRQQRDLDDLAMLESRSSPEAAIEELRARSALAAQDLFDLDLELE